MYELLVHRRATLYAVVCRRYPFIQLGEESQSGVKFFVLGNSVTVVG